MPLAASGAGCQVLAGIGDLELSATGRGGAANSSVVAQVGDVIAPTGQAQQTKLIYAEGGQLWWLFYFDAAAPTQLKTRYSDDFETWQNGASFELATPDTGDGRNLSVAYANIAGFDVVHIVLSLRLASDHRRVHHVRAAISGQSIVFGELVGRSEVIALSPSLDPDGPVTAIGTDHHVADVTSWLARANVTGDSYVIRSSFADTGASWDAQWEPDTQLEIVPFAINAHGVASMADGQFLALWEDAVAEGRPSNVRWSVGGPGPWSAPPAPVFASPYQQSVNDWAVVARTPSDVHAVRRIASGDTYEHRRFDGLGWKEGQPIGLLPGRAGHGLFLASDGEDLVLATLADEEQQSVNVARWRAGAWGPWSAVIAAPAERTYLSGWSRVVDQRVALIWTEQDPGGLTIVAARVEF